MKIFKHYKISAVGLNQTSLFSLLVKNKIFVQNLRQVSHSKSIFVISKKNFEKAQNLELFSDYKIEVKEIGSFARLVSLLPFKIGFISSILLCAIFCMLFSQRVSKIEVLGASEEQKGQIVSALQQNGIYVGKSWSQFQMRDVENVVFSSFCDIGNVSAKRTGVKLVINFQNVAKPTIQNDAILAREDCVVERIEVAKGNAKKAVGDVVLAGDTIVEPDANGEVSATVFVRIFRQASVAVSEFETKLEKTGTFCSKTVAVFPFQKEIKIPESPYEHHLLEVEEVQCFKNLFLPMRQKKYTWFELEEKQISFDDALLLAEEKAKKLAVENSNEVEVKKIEIREQNGFKFVDVFAEGVVELN